MASTSVKAETLPPVIKADPDSKSPTAQAVNEFNAPIRVKYEREPDEPKVDLSIPIAIDSEEDMFGEDYEDDEDGPIVDEIVDLTYEGLVHIQGIEHFVCKSFKIRQIPQPVVQMIDLQSLFGCLEYGSIVLNPDYQRETVWDEHRASTLINSILMGYFVPPIIFNRKLVISQTPNGKKPVYKKVCVDGKQRLTSLHKFMTGQIGIWDSNNPQKKWYFCHPKIDGKETLTSHNIMPRAVRDFFTQRRLCCYEYNELSKDTEENMFQLVQRGLALSPAEKMRAMSTEWASLAKQYEEDYEIVVNLSKQNRASGFRCVLTIFAMIQEVMAERKPKSPAPALQASPQALSRLLEDKSSISPVLKLKFKTIFDKIEILVKLSSTQITATKYEINKDSVFDPSPDFLRDEEVSHVRTFSPLELISTTVLVAYHMEHRTNEQLLNDLKELRHHLRLIHKDLRVNTACWGTVWLFISKIGTIPTAGETASEFAASSSKAGRPKLLGTRIKPKTVPKPRSKKPKPSKPRRKNPPKKRPQRRNVNRNSASPSSSELSSVPSSLGDSSDDSSDDEVMNGSFTPTFPSLVYNKTTPKPINETETNEGSSHPASLETANFILSIEDVHSVGTSESETVAQTVEEPCRIIHEQSERYAEDARSPSHNVLNTSGSNNFTSENLSKNLFGRIRTAPKEASPKITKVTRSNHSDVKIKPELFADIELKDIPPQVLPSTVNGIFNSSAEVTERKGLHDDEIDIPNHLEIPVSDIQPTEGVPHPLAQGAASNGDISSGTLKPTSVIRGIDTGFSSHLPDPSIHIELEDDLAQFSPATASTNGANSSALSTSSSEPDCPSNTPNGTAKFATVIPPMKRLHDGDSDSLPHLVKRLKET